MSSRPEGLRRSVPVDAVMSSADSTRSKSFPGSIFNKLHVSQHPPALHRFVKGALVGGHLLQDHVALVCGVGVAHLV